MDGMRCAMRIQAPEGKRLVIHIENLDIDGRQEALCQGGDYVQFFDGPSESSIIHPGWFPFLNIYNYMPICLINRFRTNTILKVIWRHSSFTGGGRPQMHHFRHERSPE